MKQGWEIKKLGEVCNIGDGNYSSKYPKATDFVSDGVPFLTATNLKNGTIVPEGIRYITLNQHLSLKKGHILKNDLVVVVRGSSTGNNSIVQTEYEGSNLNSQLAFLRVKNELELNSRYLFKVFNSPNIQKIILETITGSAQPQLPNNKLLDIKISVPPISEQQRIVSILDTAFEAIDKAKANAEQNLKNSKELFESYLQNIFSSKGSALSLSKGDGWEEKTLGDIGKPSMCKRILKNQTSITGDIPFYKIGTFGKTPNAFISKEIYNEYRTKYSFPKKGDILISASGTIGRRVRYDGEPAFFQDSNIVWIDNDEKQVLNDYLYVFYEFCDWQPSKGATIARLYNSNLTSIKIAFPKSQIEQQNIVQKLDSLSTETKKLEAIYQQKMIDLEELKKSLLEKAFKGELKTEKIEVV
jgi:type I restriction enzyme S subunit